MNLDTMTLWTTASTDPCTVVAKEGPCCSVAWCVPCGAVPAWSGTNCIVGPEEEADCKAWVTAVVMALRTSGDSCPSPLGLGMVLLPWLADEDLLGPAGAELGSLVAEEEGCNEDV